MVEIFFSIITRQAIRRGTFTSVKDLVAAISRYIDGWNECCQPFIWTNIRKFVARAHNLEDLVTLGTLNPRAAGFLRAAVIAGLNIVVSGGTQAGKTTLLNCANVHR